MKNIDSCAYDSSECSSECVLSSASWSKRNVKEGSVVQLNTLGTECNGDIFEYTIYQNTVLTTYDVVDTFTSVSLNPSWTVIYDDGPKYKF